MKILLLSATPPPSGGIASWTLKYLKYCQENDVKVDFINMALQGKRKENITAGRSIREEFLRTRRIFCEMKDKIRSKPDIVHINSSCSSFGIIRDFVILKMANARKIPVVYHCHCNVEFQIKRFYQRILIKKIAECSAQIIVLNQFSKNYFNQLGFKNSVIIPNFVEDTLINNTYIVRDELKKFIFVGHVKTEKGCQEILEAARLRPDKEFILVGPVSSEIESIKVSSNVHLLGAKPFEVVDQLYRDADAFLFPSYSEGFSLSLAEAMAEGLPIIATHVGANHDMIENSGGVIIVPKSVKSILEAMELIEEKNVREKMSIWNREKVRNCYTTDQVMKHLLTVYKTVIG